MFLGNYSSVKYQMVSKCFISVIGRVVLIPNTFLSEIQNQIMTICVERGAIVWRGVLIDTTQNLMMILLDRLEFFTSQVLQSAYWPMRFV